MDGTNAITNRYQPTVSVVSFFSAGRSHAGEDEKEATRHLLGESEGTNQRCGPAAAPM